LHESLTQKNEILLVEIFYKVCGAIVFRKSALMIYAQDKIEQNIEYIKRENPHLIILIMRVSFQRPMSHPCK
jgi:hypothetical protein